MLLNVHSWYSLRYGTIAIEQLVDRLKAAGYDCAVLTDINNTTGVLEFVQQGQEKGFHALAGVEVRQDDQLLFICIARNNAGFQEINDFLTVHNRDNRSFETRAPEFAQVFVIYPWGARGATDLRDFEYIGIRATQLTKLYGVPRADQERLVMLQPVTFLEERDFVLHCKLRAIDHNILLSRLQPHQAAGRDEGLLTADALIVAYKMHPHIIFNTHRLMEACSFHFDFTTVKNKQLYTASRYDDKLLLERQALVGCRQRYGAGNKEAERRVRAELDIIDRLGFSSYFLITWDVIREAMARGIYHVGRGSGANSIVAYCLRITDVCPIELNLYFERFLNPKRKTPPDFDIDFSWKDRDEIFDYIFTKYGARHTSLLGMMTTFKDRSIIRELGKVHGLPKTEIDLLIENPVAITNRNAIAASIEATFQQISNFPNNRSIHAGGVLISELPISAYCAQDLPPKGLLTTQFDMYTAEAIGFEKLDILSQRGIGHIQTTVEIVRRNRGIKIDVHDVPAFKKDARIASQLRTANTMGCFYIESPAMRQVLTKLACDNYITLVAASSIIRPGVGSSGMMDAYIRRYRDPASTTYLHPVLEEQLAETFGIMIYQEDVLKVGHHFGGLDLADADVLRRLMSGKNRGAHHLPAIRDKFFDNCAAKGYDPGIVAEVWRQIESFAGYSFSKAHSASFAVEGYQSLFLKTYYPLEFAVAVVNNFGGFYHTRVYLHMARQAGGVILLPCVNNSEYLTVLRGKDVFLGFVHIKGFQQDWADVIERERGRAGTFVDMGDFVLRTGIPKEQLVLLVRAGAFRFTGTDKKSLLWEADALLSPAKRPAVVAPLLLAPPTKTLSLPAFEQNQDETFYDEVELFGFAVTMSSFQILQTSYRGNAMAKDLKALVGQVVRVVGNYITQKPLRTRKGDPMSFGTFLDAEGNFLDTTHFAQSLARYPFQGAGTYLIEGEVVAQNDVPSITVHKMAKLPIRSDPRLSM